jgi:hypothetical protein
MKDFLPFVEKIHSINKPMLPIIWEYSDQFFTQFVGIIYVLLCVIYLTHLCCYWCHNKTCKFLMFLTHKFFAFVIRLTYIFFNSWGVEKTLLKIVYWHEFIDTHGSPNNSKWTSNYRHHLFSSNYSFTIFIWQLKNWSYLLSISNNEARNYYWYNSASQCVTFKIFE